MENLLNMILLVLIIIALGLFSCEVALGQYIIKQVKRIKQSFYQKFGFTQISLM